MLGKPIASLVLQAGLLIFKVKNAFREVALIESKIIIINQFFNFILAFLIMMACALKSVLGIILQIPPLIDANHAQTIVNLAKVLLFANLVSLISS